MKNKTTTRIGREDILNATTEATTKEFVFEGKITVDLEHWIEFEAEEKDYQKLFDLVFYMTDNFFRQLDKNLKENPNLFIYLVENRILSNSNFPKELVRCTFDLDSTEELKSILSESLKELELREKRHKEFWGQPRKSSNIEEYTDFVFEENNAR